MSKKKGKSGFTLPPVNEEDLLGALRGSGKKRKEGEEVKKEKKRVRHTPHVEGNYSSFVCIELSESEEKEKYEEVSQRVSQLIEEENKDLKENKLEKIKDLHLRQEITSDIFLFSGYKILNSLPFLFMKKFVKKLLY